MVRKSTKELALCSMLAALSVVLLCLGGIVPLAVYACPMLASVALLPVREECRPRYAWCCWAAVAILAVLLCPDKEAAALYVFMGYYPLLQPKLETIRRPLLRWLAKLTVAAVSVVEEFAGTAPWLLWLTVLLGLVVFAVYDIVLHRFALLWRVRRHRQ